MVEKLMLPGAKVDMRASREKGFVLVTVIVLLSLLTLLSGGLYIMSISSQQDSAASVKETQAGYYAETALSYILWAWANDADFDSTVAGVPTDDQTLGDREEWLANTTNPGPTTIGGTDGVVMYFDNSPLADRTIQLTAPVGSGPVMRNISSSLPRYIRVGIADDGNITATIPAMPHGDPPVTADIPDNGAIVWVVPGSITLDYKLDPTLAACVGDLRIASDNGCDETSSKYVAYSVAAYAIGYVDGQPLALIRSIIR